MATTTAIPVRVAPSATARIEKLDLQHEFQQMLERTLQTVVDLKAIEVTVEHDPDEPEDPTIVLSAHRPDPGPGDDSTDRDWGAWFVRAFPPDVCRHFVMLSYYEINYAR